MQGEAAFHALWIGQWLSCLGSYATSFALKAYFLHTLESSISEAAWITVACEVPALLLSPVGGFAADRWDRRRIMLWSDSVAVLGSIFIGVMVLLGELEMWHVYAAGIVQSACKAFQWPAFAASLSVLVPKERLDRANGLLELSEGLTQLLSPALASILLAYTGLRFVLIIDFISFLAGVAPLLLLVRHIPSPPLSSAGRRVASAAAGSVIREAWFLIEYLVGQHSPLVWVLALHVIENLVNAVLAELVPPLILSVASLPHLGPIVSFAGLGALVGSIAVALLGLPSRPTILLVCGLAAQGALLFAAAGPATVLRISISGFFILLLDPLISSASSLLWQRHVPSDLHGRLFGLTHCVALSAVPLGALAAGPLVSRFAAPLVAAHSTTLAPYIGEGAHRDIALVFISLGALLLLSSASAYVLGGLHRLDRLPPLQEPSEEEENNKKVKNE